MATFSPQNSRKPFLFPTLIGVSDCLYKIIAENVAIKVKLRGITWKILERAISIHDVILVRGKTGVRIDLDISEIIEVDNENSVVYLDLSFPFHGKKGDVTEVLKKCFPNMPKGVVPRQGGLRVNLLLGGENLPVSQPLPDNQKANGDGRKYYVAKKEL